MLSGMKRLIVFAVCVAACARSATTTAPAPLPDRWNGVIGEYESPQGMRIVLEDSGRLYISDSLGRRSQLDESAARFDRDASGRATAATINGVRMPRRNVEPLPGQNQLQVKPVRPVEEVRKEALVASPPHETGTFRAPDLVELTSLDPTIKLEIRYATTNNFLGTRFYDEARAFMQRPAAEAVVRANQALKAEGFGLLIHDAYRPWYVTKMFWDATPLDKRWLVADPAQGSKHNRGSAVDLTLYDLSTGRALEMPSTYDETSDRAYANYPGGTALQRWRRAVLRRAMEAQGFTANPTEWWHFDYKDWRQYPIGNVTFNRIGKP
jgi:D-alanyl-D-alanine dipeptidase